MSLRWTRPLFGAALAAVGGCGGYAANRYYVAALTDGHGLDPKEAIDNLNRTERVNTSIRSLEALYHLNKGEFERISAELTTIARCQLAICGSKLCDTILPTPHDEHPIIDNCEALLGTVELDRDWEKAFKWYTVNVCAEDDLQCQDEPMWNRPSKLSRFHRVLHVLLYNSETGDCDQLVDQNVPFILWNLFHKYRSEQHKIFIQLILKITANIAAFSPRCAHAIADSHWLPTLSQMITRPVIKDEPLLAHKVLANVLYSLGASKYPLPPNVYELIRPDAQADPLLDVIFVHGFRGSVFRTWRQKDDLLAPTVQNWPRAWLPLDIDKNIRVLGLDYASKLLKFGEVIDSIEKRSEKFQRSLELCQVGTRPIVFICHSMGGLLVKHMLTANARLRERTAVVVFIATPHRGTPVMSAYVNYLRPTEDAEFLRIDSELNRELNARFSEVATEIPMIISLVENRETKLLGKPRLIVPPESAVFGAGAVYHIDEHHHNICKPSDSRAPAYCVIVNAIKYALNSIVPNQNTNASSGGNKPK